MLGKHFNQEQTVKNKVHVLRTYFIGIRAKFAKNHSQKKTSTSQSADHHQPSRERKFISKAIKEMCWVFIQGET